VGAEHTTSKKHEPVGPFAPPLPSEADRKDGQPMAAAADEDQRRESAKPTTQNADQMSRETAQRWRDPNLGPLEGAEDAKGLGPESKAQERAPGYADRAQAGYKEMDAQED